MNKPIIPDSSQKESAPTFQWDRDLSWSLRTDLNRRSSGPSEFGENTQIPVIKGIKSALVGGLRLKKGGGHMRTNSVRIGRVEEFSRLEQATRVCLAHVREMVGFSGAPIWRKRAGPKSRCGKSSPGSPLVRAEPPPTARASRRRTLGSRIPVLGGRLWAEWKGDSGRVVVAGLERVPSSPVDSTRPSCAQLRLRRG